MSWKDVFPVKNRYYETENGILYKSDNSKIMSYIPEGTIDLILTDPPYGISKELTITRGDKMKFKGKDLNYNFGEWDKFKSFEEQMEIFSHTLDLFDSVLRDGGIIASYYDRDKINFVSKYLQDKYRYKTKGYFAHLKSNPVPQARKVKWMNGWEMIGIWQKPGGKLTYNYQLGQQKDWGVYPIVSGNERTKHPTQKPLKLMELIISYWSNEGDMVLDPFLGSGTTAIACEKLGRRWIGIEINGEYCKIAKERIRIETNQLKLF